MGFLLLLRQHRRFRQLREYMPMLLLRNHENYFLRTFVFNVLNCTKQIILFTNSESSFISLGFSGVSEIKGKYVVSFVKKALYEMYGVLAKIQPVFSVSMARITVLLLPLH